MLLSMSKTHFKSKYQIEIMPKPLIRRFTIKIPCKICKTLTQDDPYNKYFFGACCSDCSFSLNQMYNNLITKNDLNNNDDTKAMFFTLIKNNIN